MGTMTPEQGYFSVLRWRRDATRDEARNVAVILVDHDGAIGGIRYAPVSSISPRLREQGLLDAMLVSLERQFQDERKPDLKALQRMYESMRQSLYFTEPQPTAVLNVDDTLGTLFRAYVAPQTRPRNRFTKGAILDRAIDLLRRQGLVVRRSQRVKDFFFDIVVELEESKPHVLEVLTFATGKKEPIAAEHDAGHFLYALDRLDLQGVAIVQPPGPQASESVIASYDRVTHWLSEAEVSSTTPEDLANEDLPLAFRAG